MIIESNIKLNFESSMINGKLLFCMYVNAFINKHCCTIIHLYLTGVLIVAIGNTKYETQHIVLNSVTQ